MISALVLSKGIGNGDDELGYSPSSARNSHPARDGPLDGFHVEHAPAEDLKSQLYTRWFSSGYSDLTAARIALVISVVRH